VRILSWLFFDLREALLADENRVFGARKIELRIKPARVFVMSHVGGFYAAARKDIFFGKKKLSRNILIIFQRRRGRTVTFRRSFSIMGL
jgi:hypothetical protein